MTIESNLHHYTTPTRARHILSEGLEPLSRLPGTRDDVAFAFLGELPGEWSNGMRNYIPPCDFLTQILSRSIEENDAGIVEITFNADEAYVFDRAFGPDLEGYLGSGVTLEHYRNNTSVLAMKKPEAVVGPVPSSDLHVGDVMNETEARELIRDFFYI